MINLLKIIPFKLLHSLEASPPPQPSSIDVNTASKARLEIVKGIGPKKAKAIIDERIKNGLYKDDVDFITRLKGFSEISVEKLKKAGLTFGNVQISPVVGSHLGETRYVYSIL